MPEIIDATPADIPLIQSLAERTWWPTYSSIVSDEQIRFMLNAIYTPEALLTSMTEGAQQFILIRDEHGVQGFAAYGPRKEDATQFKLHKLYVLPENQGKGYGAKLIDEVKRRLLALNVHALDLNVNRHNAAKNFYERVGFVVVYDEDVAIGPYWMNDYVMRITF
ncbi:GNAT family N-acetyltransferase [Chryseolinea lacunae]|uniref:GNAT family N-acetyltransferase n=1 Tax=Chryseolinea lacunae TaxID=2801331 RepID=A0ABS1KWW3_9BACT|nr:GNAT family N-acetyltransferase [Chryseolinea lacunae]MBL0743747.1 GNAT family N-acetyltransferase [Chryseolinea lacunae]